MLAAELILAFAYPQPTWRRVRANSPAMFAVSDTLPYRLRPGYAGRQVREEYAVRVHIDSLGFRGSEITRPKDGRTRIIGLGDSFTFGYGVEDDEAYSARTESLLRHIPGFESVEFINAGVASGLEPDTYYLYTKLYGVALSPDLITVGVFIGNDIEGRSENRWASRDQAGLPTVITNTVARVDEDGYFVERKRSFAYSVPVLRNSHLFHLVGAAFRRAQTLSRSPERSPSIYDAVYDSNSAKAFAKCGRLLVALDSVARQGAVPVLVIFIPTREQVLTENLRPSDAFDLSHPQRALREILDQHQIPVLDLLDAMRQSVNRREFYFEKDLHWTRVGHEFAAHQLAVYIAGKALFQKGPRKVGRKIAVGDRPSPAIG